MVKKILFIVQETLPILLMVGLIPLVRNDYLLTVIYSLIIFFCFLWKTKKHDPVVFTVGFIAMTIFETLFIITGVEVFNRNSLFGIMPLWLPFLWGYGFVVMKRSIEILKA